MGLVYQYLYFAGKSSEDFKCHISGSGTFLSPSRDVQSVSVPGRNGDLHLDGGRFFNVEITYPAFITKDFRANFDALKAFLLAQRGYKRLEDSYHPEYFRRAMFKGAIEPQMTTLNRAGSFELKFDCDPRRFLKDGERVVDVDEDITLINRTEYEAKPLVRAYGTGTFTIADTTVQIVSADGYTDIDCDLQEAYKGAVNCNNNIVLTDGKFPELITGGNEISFTGLTKLEITPRWWTV